MLKVLLTICIVVLVVSSKNCDECFSMPVLMIKASVCGIIFFVGSIYFTRIFLQTEKEVFTIDMLPLLETNEASTGVPFCCEGTIRQGETILTSPFTLTPCIYYHSIVEDYKKQGKHSEWVIVENLVNYVPFYLEDKRGTIKVDVSNMDSDFSGYKIEKFNRIVPDPDKSEIDATPVLKHATYEENRTTLAIFHTTHELRRSEFVLMPRTSVFVHGYVSKRNGELVLHEHDRHPLIISTKTKDTYVEEFYKGRHLIYFVHFLMTVGFTIAMLSANYFLHIDPVLLYAVIYIGNAGIVGSIIFTMYNRLVTLQNRAQTALSNIDIELKRRADLIPQIVMFVKEYASHEKRQHLDIASTRLTPAFMTSLPKEVPTSFIDPLLVVENYPHLKASENYQSLMRSLVDTEERIAYSRTFYNRNTRKYNALIAQFPFIIIAQLLGFKPMEFLTFQTSRSPS